MKKLTDKQTVWLALNDAYQWAESFLDAMDGCPEDPAYERTKKRMAAYERVANKYYGRGIRESSLDAYLMKVGKAVPIQEIWKQNEKAKAKAGT